MTNVFVNSPLQALCAYEALMYYKIERFEVFVVPSVNETNIIYQTEFILKTLSFEYKILTFKDYVSVIKYKDLTANSADICISGDYLSPIFRILMSKCIKRHGKVIYVDDGSSTVSLFKTKHPFIKRGFKTMAKMIIPTLYYYFKQPKEVVFSMFDDEGSVRNTVKNTFSNVTKCFNIVNNNSIKEGLFIIGTKYNIFFKTDEYLQFLNGILTKLDYKSFKNIYYCPHRAEINDPHVIQFCIDNNIEYYVTKGCVEVSFITDCVKPDAIVSLGSTASYTLQRIFPDSKSYVFMIPYEKMTSYDADDYRIIYNDMEKQGIVIIKSQE